MVDVKAAQAADIKIVNAVKGVEVLAVGMDAFVGETPATVGGDLYGQMHEAIVANAGTDAAVSHDSSAQM